MNKVAWTVRIYQPVSFHTCCSHRWNISVFQINIQKSHLWKHLCSSNVVYSEIAKAILSFTSLMENQTWSDACLSVGLLTKGVTVLSTHCPLCRTHRQPILWMITTQRLYYLPRIESGGDLRQISTPCFWCDFKELTLWEAQNALFERRV